MKDEKVERCDDRRDFLKKAAALAAGTALAGGGVLAQTSTGAQQATNPNAEPYAKNMPMVPFGKEKISRIILGCNVYQGASHIFPTTERTLHSEFYTVENIMELYRRCEEVGINYCQVSPTAETLQACRKHHEQGGKMKMLVSQQAMVPDQINLDLMKLPNATALMIMGEVTDRAFKQGEVAIEKLHDEFKRMKDRGLFPGMATHDWRNAEYIEEKNWGCEFYHVCAYNIRRTPDEFKKLLGPDLPEGEIYLKGDPARAAAFAKKVSKPCILFKILAAGRLAPRANAPTPTDIFQTILSSIKPTDPINVGMSIQIVDEPDIDAQLVIKASKAPVA